MPVQPLTPRQQQVLNFITDYIDGHGYPPTLREIGRHLNIRSTNGVSDHLKALERKGHLSRDDLKSRALRPVTHASTTEMISREAANGFGTSASEGAVVRDINSARLVQSRGTMHAALPVTESSIGIPIIGRVAAGEPLLAVENVEDTVQVDRFFIGTGDGVFGLRVKGDSMIDAGIHDGDFIFVRKQLHARKGEIVVAMIEGEATVKYYFPEGDRVRFQPANDSMEPIYVTAQEFRSVDLVGVVVGVYRKVGR
ncbi:MAG: transcriptional repressor LexA [Deltaproteobacteria bacterium]|nr:transcriptional repressor LexA [Deltaproteobacteria bacterium]